MSLHTEYGLTHKMAEVLVSGFVENKFVLNAIPYTARDERRSQVISLAETVAFVLQWTTLFTSTAVVAKLLKQKMPVIWAIRPNKKCIPKEIVSIMSDKKTNLLLAATESIWQNRRQKNQKQFLLCQQYGILQNSM